MSLSTILDPNGKNDPQKALYVYSVNTKTINTDEIKTGGIILTNVPASSLPVPANGEQVVFGNSSSNGNISVKTSTNSVVSLSSAISNFIVSSNPDDGMKYTTIQAAIDDAKLTGNEETIIIRSGIYNENITLVDMISLQGVGPGFGINTYPVQINGSIQFSSGQSYISNIYILATNANCITITGSGLCNLGASEVLLSATGGSGDCVNVNNPTASILFRNCNFIESPGMFINITDSNTVLSLDCIIGILPSNPGSIQNSGNGVLAILYSVINAQITITNNAAVFVYTCLSPNNGDYPVFNLNGAATIVLLTNNTIFSDGSSGTDFIIGTGGVITGNNSLIGRTTAAGTVTVIPMTIF